MTLTNAILRRSVAATALAAALALAAPAPAQQGDVYRIGVGDVVDISIYGQPDLSGERRIRADGSIAIHLLGAIPAAGMTIAEIEAAVAQRVSETFETETSVIADVVGYRDIYVAGDVQRPGVHGYRPGLTVIKALALAEGVRRGFAADGQSPTRVVDERRRMLLAQRRLAEADAEIAALDAETARLDAGDAPLEPAAGEPPLHALLARMRREALEVSVEGARQQRRLAEDEAKSFEERGAIIGRQLEATQKNLADIDSLVRRGLARRDRQLDLAVDADNFRADALEAAAFEARARQTAANAENTIRTVTARYREALVSARINAGQQRDLAQVEFETSRAFLQEFGDAWAATPSLAPPVEVYEIVRDGAEGPIRLSADPSTPMMPGDVLTVTLAETPGG